MIAFDNIIHITLSLCFLFWGKVLIQERGLSFGTLFYPIPKRTLDVNFEGLAYVLRLR